MARKNGRFTPEVRAELRKEAHYRCQSCGTVCNELEVHHRLPVGIAEKLYPKIPKDIVGSKENGKVLCPACHERENRISRTYHEEFARDLKKRFNLR